MITRLQRLLAALRSMFEEDHAHSTIVYINAILFFKIKMTNNNDYAFTKTVRLLRSMFEEDRARTQF